MRGNSFAVRQTNTGLGLFTLRPISEGTRIVEYLGKIIPLEEAKSRKGKFLFELDSKRVIDGGSRCNIARYINHSCKPNAEAATVNCRLWIYAKRSLHAGEEITINYGIEYFDEIIKPKGCKCKQCQSRRVTVPAHAPR